MRRRETKIWMIILVHLKLLTFYIKKVIKEWVTTRMICRSFIIKLLHLVLIRTLICPIIKWGLIKILLVSLTKTLFMTKPMNFMQRTTMCSLEEKTHQGQPLVVVIIEEAINWVEVMIRLILRRWAICSAETIMILKMRISIFNNNYMVTWRDSRHQKDPEWTSTRHKTTLRKQKKSKKRFWRQTKVGMIHKPKIDSRRVSHKTKAKVVCWRKIKALKIKWNKEEQQLKLRLNIINWPI